MTIQRVAEGGEISDLQTMEDLPDRGARLRFGTNTVDCAGLWTSPSDGTYQVQINDLFGSQRGDVRLAYTLAIRHPRPDYTLVALPESSNQPDAVVIPAGGRALGYVLALRTDGFNGPIQVTATDLPAGLRFEPVIIPSGQSFAPFVLEAKLGAGVSPSTVQLIGRSRFEDRKDALDYVSGFTKFEVDQTREAIAGAVVWTGGNPADNNRQGAAPARLTQSFAVQVADLPSFRINVSPSRRYATPGGLLSIDVHVERRSGFEEAVNLTLATTLPNLRNPPTLVIPKTETEGTFHLTVPKEMGAGLYSLVLQGTGTVPFSPDPKAEKKPNVTVSEPSNPIEVVVIRSPLKLTISPKGSSIKAGGELELDVTAKGLNGTFPVALVAPPRCKLFAESGRLVDGETWKWKIKAAADAPEGAALGLGVKVMFDPDREGAELIEPLPLTITK